MRYVLSLVLAVCLLAAPVWADYGSGPKGEIARASWELIGRTEQANGIPAGLLHAMSLTETGRGVSGWMMPWPYTVGVNSTGQKSYLKLSHAERDLEWMRKIGFSRFDITVAGMRKNNIKQAEVLQLFRNNPAATLFTIKPRPYGKRLANAAEAERFAHSLFGLGHRNLDVGLMQINWRVHGHKFRSVADLFNPVVNVNYAANYLLEHRQTRDWWGSVGRYHSGTPKYAKRYVGKVYGWYKKVHDFNAGRQLAAR